MNMQVAKPTRAEMVHELMVKLGEVEFALETSADSKLDKQKLIDEHYKLAALLVKLTNGAPKSLPASVEESE